MTGLENISSLLNSYLNKKKKKKAKNPATKTMAKYKLLEEKNKIMTYKILRLLVLKQRGSHLICSLKRTSAILKHPVLFMLLLFFTMSVWAIVIHYPSSCWLQLGLKKLVSVQILWHYALHLTLTSVCLSISFVFHVSLSGLIKKVSQ